jgi:hypothetical protein
MTGELISFGDDENLPCPAKKEISSPEKSCIFLYKICFFSLSHWSP